MAERVMRTIGRPELIDDPRFRTNSDRLKNVEVLDGIIAEFFARYTQAEAVALMEQAEVTVGPIYDASQILEDRHVIEREILADYDDPELGAFPMHHVVPRLDGTPGSIRSPAPGLGQDNRAILSEIGVDEATYAEWLSRGVAVEGGK
jgi:formyl-CoA transferase